MAISKVVFAPCGNGAGEYKYWEAFTVNTVVLTDYEPSQVELMRGLPVIMLRGGLSVWQNMMPSRLSKILDKIAKQPETYELMRGFPPCCTDATHTYDGRLLAAPLVYGAYELKLLGDFN